MTNYQQNFASVEDEYDEISKYFSQEKFVNPIICNIMTQYGIWVGLSKFKKHGGMAVTKELEQIHDL